MDTFDDLLAPSRTPFGGANDDDNPFANPFSQRSGSPDPWGTPFATTTTTTATTITTATGDVSGSALAAGRRAAHAPVPDFGGGFGSSIDDDDGGFGFGTAGVGLGLGDENPFGSAVGSLSDATTLTTTLTTTADADTDADAGPPSYSGSTIPILGGGGGRGGGGGGGGVRRGTLVDEDELLGSDAGFMDAPSRRLRKDKSLFGGDGKDILEDVVPSITRSLAATAIATATAAAAHPAAPPPASDPLDSINATRDTGEEDATLSNKDTTTASKTVGFREVGLGDQEGGSKHGSDEEGTKEFSETATIRPVMEEDSFLEDATMHSSSSSGARVRETSGPSSGHPAAAGESALVASSSTPSASAGHSVAGAGMENSLGGADAGGGWGASETEAWGGGLGITVSAPPPPPQMATTVKSPGGGFMSQEYAGAGRKLREGEEEDVEEEDDSDDDKPIGQIRKQSQGREALSSAKKDAGLQPVFVVTVDDPQKVGDPIRQYIMYTVHTRTTSPMFQKSAFSVLRRYSDFVWLYEALSLNNPGVVVPPVPEKNAFGRFDDTFVKQRRFALQKCIQKIANHPVLGKDTDLKLFLESDTFALDIKHRKAEIAHEKGGFMASLGQAVTGPRFHETDEWFDKQKTYLDSLESQLRGLAKSIEMVARHRIDLATVTSEFGQTVQELAESDVGKHLSHSLSGLAEVERKAQDIQNTQAEQDMVTLMATVDEYARLINSVRMAFNSRIRMFHAWKNSESDLLRIKQSHERNRAQGKIPTERLSYSLSQIAEAERRALESKHEYDHVSKLVKAEMARFEQERIEDFKDSLHAFLEGMISRQKELIGTWENYQHMLLAKMNGSSSSPLPPPPPPPHTNGGDSNGSGDQHH